MWPKRYQVAQKLKSYQRYLWWRAQQLASFKSILQQSTDSALQSAYPSARIWERQYILPPLLTLIYITNHCNNKLVVCVPVQHLARGSPTSRMLYARTASLSAPPFPFLSKDVVYLAQIKPAALAVIGERASSFQIWVKIMKQVFKGVPLPLNCKPICFFYLVIATNKKQVLCY